MKWNIFLEKCKTNEKLTFTEEELTKMYNEKVAEVKALGFEDGKIEDAAVARLHAYLIKHFNSDAPKFTGIIIGASRTTDFGAKKLYDLAIKTFKENPEDAITRGIVNDNGVPIYVTPEWRRGQKIDLSTKSRALQLLVKAQDGSFTKATLNLRDKRVDNVKIQYFKEVEFRALKSDKSTPELTLLNDCSLTEFKVVKNLQIDDVKQLLVKYYKEHLVSLPAIDKYHTDNAMNMNRLAIVKGNIGGISLTKDSAESNIINLIDQDFEIGSEDGGKPLSCWVSKKDFPINFDEYALDVIVIGKTNRGLNDQKVTMEVYGLFVDDIYRKKEMPLPLQKETIEEVAEEDWKL